MMCWRALWSPDCLAMMPVWGTSVGTRTRTTSSAALWVLLMQNVLWVHGCVPIPILPYCLVGQRRFKYAPIHSIHNAVCQKYHNVLLHWVPFCSIQASMHFLGNSYPQSSAQRKICHIDWAAETATEVAMTDDTKRVKVQGVMLWQSTMPQLYAYCMQQYVLL